MSIRRAWLLAMLPVFLACSGSTGESASEEHQAISQRTSILADFDPPLTPPAELGKARLGEKLSDVDADLLEGYQVDGEPDTRWPSPITWLKKADSRRLGFRAHGFGMDSVGLTFELSDDEIARHDLIPETTFAGPAGTVVTEYARFTKRSAQVPWNVTMGPRFDRIEVRRLINLTVIEEPADAVTDFEPSLYGGRWTSSMKLLKRESVVLDTHGKVFRHFLTVEGG